MIELISYGLKVGILFIAIIEWREIICSYWHCINIKNYRPTLDYYNKYYLSDESFDYCISK